MNVSKVDSNEAMRTDEDVIIISIVLVISIMLFIVIIYVPPSQGRHELIAFGAFYINNSGESHGGFEYAGTFYANLTRIDGNWSLELSLKAGLGDPRPYRAIKVCSNFFSNGDMIQYTERGRIVLELMLDDPIWGNMLNECFVAIYSPYGPAAENIGEISAEIFGLPAHYYAQLSLRPVPLSV